MIPVNRTSETRTPGNPSGRITGATSSAVVPATGFGIGLMKGSRRPRGMYSKPAGTDSAGGGSSTLTLFAGSAAAFPAFGAGGVLAPAGPGAGAAFAPAGPGAGAAFAAAGPGVGAALAAPGTGGTVVLPAPVSGLVAPVSGLVAPVSDLAAGAFAAVDGLAGAGACPVVAAFAAAVWAAAADFTSTGAFSATCSSAQAVSAQQLISKMSDLKCFFIFSPSQSRLKEPHRQSRGKRTSSLRK